MVDPSSDPFAKRPDRRSVQMRAYLVRADKQVLDVTVSDLSYSGCLIATETPLNAGESVVISVLGRGGGRALVRWYRDRQAGLEFEPEEVPRKQAPRSSDRQPIDAEVLLRRSAQGGYRVQVFDASPKGCRCEFIERPNIGERVWVKFDGLEAIESEVRWLKEASVGLNFVKSIHPAVFDLLMERLGK